ncbi:MAG: VWA domain-containing protein [Candidatus Hydrogenedentes bacterium]|nr:VWA domain-containing protein [Candidatus Hydrogenedentota bacterium]
MRQGVRWVAVLLLAAAGPAVVASDPPVGTPPPRIQLALLLDTSNSMDGLIDQAKSHLWRIVNEFVPARLGDRSPVLEVALYEYGNNGLSAESDWVRLVLPFTTDLDLFSEMLFGLRTNGGKEFCGAVIERAAGGLAWSGAASDLKAVFIAGNEPFNQGHADYRVICPRARERGIAINTIFCGERQEGVATFWQDGANLGGGRFLHIDQNKEIRHIDAPQDSEITRLGLELNQTYIPYGASGAAGASNQIRQDSNAASRSRSVAVERQKVKGSRYYSNDHWDLVDAAGKGVKVREIPDGELPAIMRAMSPEERAAYVEQKQKERNAIQEQIRVLSAARDVYIAEQQRKQGGASQDGLDAAIIATVRDLAASKGFRFE